MTNEELLSQLATAIENHPGNATSVQEDGTRVDYAELADLIKQYNSLQAKTALTSGNFSRRTYAKNGGRGL